jgi:hypothetical protein
MEEMRNTYEILLGNLQEKNSWDSYVYTFKISSRNAA